MGFERGQRVEILDQGEGFEDSFYPAVVISQVSNKKYMIQYSTLYDEDEQLEEFNEFKPSREFRKEKEIRPTPPEVIVEEFVVNDMVDAYYKDGWWIGIIRRVVKEGGIKKYFVYFEATEETIGFEVGELRLHQVWSQGQWSFP